MSELASFFVRIRPDTRFFKQEAEAGIRAGKPDDVAVGVSADTTSADDKLRTFSGRLDALRLKTATVGIDLNDRGAVGKLAALDAAIDRLDRLRANPKVDVDGIARAEAEVESLNLQLDRLDGRRVTAGSGGRGGLFNRLAGYGSSGGFFSPGGFAGLALGLAPAAVPAGVGALGLGASFLTPGVAGTAGLGLFGAATAGAYKRVSKVEDQLDTLNKRIAVTPQTTSTTTGAASASQIKAATLRLDAARQRLAVAEVNPASSIASLTSARAGVLSAQSSLASLQARGGTTTKPNAEYDKLVKQRKQLLDSLSPAERKAAEETDKLEKVWTHFQQALEPESFKLLATGLDIVTKALRDAEPMTKAVGDDIDSLAKRADDALSQPFWKNFFGDFLTVEAPRAVDALGTTVGNVVTGIAHLSEVWTPLGHSLETEMVSISSRFDQWTQGSGPVRFMQIVERDGPVAAKAVESLAHALVGIANGVEPIGRIELQALTPVLNFIGDLGKQDPAVITALGIAYLTVAGGLKAIAAANSVKKTLDNAKLGLSDLRRGALLTAGAIGAFEIGRHSTSATEATLGGALSGLAAGFLAFGPEGAVVGAFAGGVLSLGSWIAKARGEVQSFTADVDALASSLTNAVQADKGLLGKNVKQQVQQLLSTNPEFSSQPGKFGLSLLQTMAKYGVTIDDLISRAQGGYPADYARMISAAKASGNETLINQATDLIFAIQQALRNANALNAVSGGIGGGGSSKKFGGAPGSSTGGGGGAATVNLGSQGVSGGVDYSTGVAAGIVASIPKVEQAVATLGERANAKLKSLQQQEQSMAKSIADSLLGTVGLANLGSTPDSLGGTGGIPGSVAGIITGLRGQETSLRQFRHRLHVLRQRGLSVREARTIVGLGLQQGGALEQTLLAGTPKELRQISHLDAQLRRQAHQTGQSIAHDIFGGQIKGLKEALHEVNKTIHEATSRHRALTDSDYHRLKQILDDALHGNPVSLDTGKTGRHSARKVDVS